MSRISRVALVGALLVGAAASASAQINFVGVTSYAFSTTSYSTQSAINSSGLSFSSTATLLGHLHISADPVGGFNVTSVANTANDGDVSISTSGNSIGIITLDNVSQAYGSSNWLYIKTVFSPPNITSSPIAVYFKAKITGGTDGIGGSTAAYTTFISSVGGTYTEGSYFGSYTYTFNGHNLAVGPTVIDGHIFEDHDIDSSIAPEPASLVLLGSGLFGIAAVARRRRNRAA